MFNMLVLRYDCRYINKVFTCSYAQKTINFTWFERIKFSSRGSVKNIREFNLK